MKTVSLKLAIMRIFIVAIVGFALTALTGCGINHGLYRPGYGGRNHHNNTGFYRGGYGYFDNASIAHEYNADNRAYGSMRSYGPGRNGFCTW